MRWKWFGWSTAGLLLAGALGLLGYATFIEPRRLTVEHHEVDLPLWGDPGHPVKVALVADLHVALWEGGWVDRIVRTVQEEHPDVILLLGDYRNAVCYRCSMSPEDVAEHLRPLAATAPVFYVTGNHDLLPWSEQLHRAFRKVGFVCLENRTERVALKGAPPLDFRGISYYSNLTHLPVRHAFPKEGRQGEKQGGKQEDKPEGQQVENVPLVAVVHNPYHFLRLKLGGDIVFAGHTHGGQVRWPNGSAVLSPTDWTRENLRDGWRQGAAGQPVYISRGIGMSNLPFRVNCPPEVSIITLH